MKEWLVDPLLEGVPHGFGMRGSRAPELVCRPTQVHGTQIAYAEHAAAKLGEADAVVTRQPGVAVGVVTADCVPVLLVDRSAGVVAAVHAGWRGLAAGVVARAVEALCECDAERSALRAVVGPHIGAECYEVDAPVIEGLRARFGAETERALSATGPGHARLALGPLVVAELVAAGIARSRIGTATAACTRCDSERFHSYRRDGARAGRMLHWISLPKPNAEQG